MPASSIVYRKSQQDITQGVKEKFKNIKKALPGYPAEGFF